MNTNAFHLPTRRAIAANYLTNPIRFFIISILAFTTLFRATAQPTIDSTTPADGATGVAINAQVVFNFSAAMDESATTVQFFSFAGGVTFYTASTAWNSSSNILTCTPTSPWPTNTTITWVVNGQDLGGNPLGGTPTGTFTTAGGGGGGGGSGTNAITVFTIGKGWLYTQASSGAPTLNPTAPYFFDGITSLSSNRTATNVSIGLPGGGVSNLFQNPLHHEEFIFTYSTTNLTTFNSTFPAGSYQFTVASVSSNQQVTVTLPASFTQPNAPHITNYTAAQSITATQAFTLGWDAFTGGTTADFISLSIGSSFQTGGFGQTNALSGTAKGVTIPANTLQPGSNYNASIGFYHATATTNSGYVTEAWLATVTEFTVSTAAASGAARPVMTNAVWSTGKFNFDVISPPSQMITIVCNTNLNSASTNWPVMLTTNTPAGGSFHVSDPRSTTNKIYFYRARNGP
jgi:hypothetical protein